MRVPYFMLFYLTLFIASPLIIFLHELGHSFVALLFTRKRVQMFIGSYGNMEKNYHLQIGKLDTYIEKDITKWRKGLCIHTPTATYYQEILIIVSGPLLPFLFAMLFSINAVIFLGENIVIASVFFLIFSSLSLIYNLIPGKEAIELENGNLTYNDGQLLLNLLKHKKNFDKYVSAINTYNEQKYAEAILLFNNLLKNGFDSQITYRFLITSHMQLNNFNEAKFLIEESIAKYEQDSDDYANAGLTYSRLGLYEEALNLYDKSLEINTLNLNTYNNKGYTLNLLERYDQAIIMFNKALDIDCNYAYAYNNRGLAKIKTSKIEEGLEDMKISMAIDPNNAYCYKNMGIYHFDKLEYQKALEYFERAKELD